MTQWGLDTLFNPAKRHMDEEKRRLQSTREEIGDNSGGRRIDLESGRVIINRHDAEEAPNEHHEDEPKPGRRSRADRKSASDKQPTAAQKRAAERRGRKL